MLTGDPEKPPQTGRRLSTLVIETTLRCDQACVFCGSRGGVRAEGELTTAEMRRVIADAAALGAEQLELTGGETYLRDDWLELIAAVHDAGLGCALITAGRGIDLVKARAAKDAGLARASVSIDGLGPTHDALRGVAGSFDGAFQALAAFRDAGVPVGCNTQLGAKNWRELPALADMLLAQGLYGWQIQLMIPMGRASENESLWLQPFEILDVVPLIASVIDACAAHGLRAFAADNVGYFGPHEQTLRRWNAKRGHTVGCAAGSLGLAIDPAGDVKGCSSLDGQEFVAGNVRTDALADLWNGSPVVRRMEDFDPAALWGLCASCYYAEVCRGGCSSTAVALTGRPGNNPYCHHRAIELAKQGLRERLMPRHLVRRGFRGFVAFDVITELAP
jgi:radical SAM protein with 4Fe4S-binding SPASM domain